jgi:hypothetical protein
MTTSFEEAKQCPKCGNIGEDWKQERKTLLGPPRKNVVVHYIKCVTQLCPWFETSYVVQVNEDGSIPEAYSALRGEKQFPKASPEMETRIREATEAQLRAETRPGGGEINNPRSQR